MDRKPESTLPSGNGEAAARSKETADRRKALDQFLGLSAERVTVDESAFELLTRGASEEETRAVRRLLIEWSKGDENSFPHQLSLLTRAQWRAAAAVPVETAKVLQQHQSTAQNAARQIAQAADAKLSEFASIGKLAAQLESSVGRLSAHGDEHLEWLQKVTSSFRQAEHQLRTSSRRDDIKFLVVILTLFGLLGFGLGYVTCLYMHSAL